MSDRPEPGVLEAMEMRGSALIHGIKNFEWKMLRAANDANAPIGQRLAGGALMVGEIAAAVIAYKVGEAKLNQAFGDAREVATGLEDVFRDSRSVSRAGNFSWLTGGVRRMAGMLSHSEPVAADGLDSTKLHSAQFFTTPTKVDGLSVREFYRDADGAKHFINADGLEGPGSATDMWQFPTGMVRHRFGRETPIAGFKVKEMEIGPGDRHEYTNAAGLLGKGTPWRIVRTGDMTTADFAEPVPVFRPISGSKDLAHFVGSVQTVRAEPAGVRLFDRDEQLVWEGQDSHLHFEGPQGSIPLRWVHEHHANHHG